ISKLVPGAEILPFAFLFKPFEGLALDLGGTTGTLGSQKERSAFKNTYRDLAVAPVICYESVYADYVTAYMRNGANLIFIITNDGWWGNTPGHLQHLNYARLRAIEGRRQIARSANTGISCFIDEFGNVSEATEYWQEAVIQKNMQPIYELTFFSRFGDLLSYASCLLTIVVLAWSVFSRFRK
ncbi:MAG: apolipoprotein N-acyltransferase, partial [Bacteroidia bacterium]|nr:apolipoprotein N-acyltransferase [Bacteroidia bacterium]